MKKVLLFAGLVSLFAACTEKGFDVTPLVEGGDTTYMATPEAAQPRTVVLEEFTGVKCPNCPSGHQKVATMTSQYANRFISVSYYAYGLPQADTIKGMSGEDFRTEDATNLLSAVFVGVGGLPAASVDRAPVNGQLTVFQDSWISAVAARIGTPSPANVTMTSEWNESTSTAIIRVRVAYTAAVSKTQALTLLLTENDLVDVQESTDTVQTSPTFGQAVVLPAYTFKHVLRDIITPVTGEVLLNEFETKERGRVYERTFIYEGLRDKTWKADKCTVVAMLHNIEANDKEIVQAAEIKLVE